MNLGGGWDDIGKLRIAGRSHERGISALAILLHVMVPSEAVLIVHTSSLPMSERAVSEIPPMRAAGPEHITESPIRWASVATSAGRGEGKEFGDWDGFITGEFKRVGMIKREDEMQHEMQDEMQDGKRS